MHCDWNEFSSNNLKQTAIPYKRDVKLLTFLLTSRSRALLEKLTSSQLLKKFSIFYGAQRFITSLTNVPHTCPCPEPDQFIPSLLSHFLTIHFSIILPSTPGSSKWSLYLRLPDQNRVYTFPLTPLCYLTRLSHSSRFDYPNNIG